MKGLKRFLLGVAAVCMLFAVACNDKKENVEDNSIVHELMKTEEKAADCTTDGNVEYYTCVVCGKYYADEEATVELSEEELVIKASHSLTYYEGVAPVGKTNGSTEYWACTGGCEGYFADEEATTEITLEDTVIVAAMNIPDFLVEVEEGAILLCCSFPTRKFGLGERRQKNNAIVTCVK